MKVSVVIPMYNVEQYICQCLDSLKAQTLKDIEYIIVNDGSTDHSPELAQKYVDEDPEHFSLLHKKNGGLSDARNYGIPYAKGKYLAFLDSDDFVEETLYEKMYHAAEHEQADVVVCDIEYYYEDPSRRFVMKGVSERSTETMAKRMLLSPMFAWNKMYRKTMFLEHGYQYPLNTWYEDIPVTTMVFVQAKGFAYVNEPLIHYRQREGSIMSNVSNPRIKEIFGIMELVRSNFEKTGLTDAYHDELEYLHIEHLRLYGMFRFIRSTYWKDLYAQSQKVMEKYYPSWKHNPYMKSLGLKNRIFLKCYNALTACIFNKMIR